MFCGKCGTSIPEGNSFCSNCGSPIDIPVAQPSGQTNVNPIQPTPIVMSAPQPEPIKRRNGFATVGLMFGILAALFSLSFTSTLGSDANSGISLIIVITYPMSILGIVFSRIGISKSKNYGGKGIATAGLILSICSFFVPVLFLGIGTYLAKAAAVRGS